MVNSYFDSATPEIYYGFADNPEVVPCSLFPVPFQGYDA
jgi:hypothetical protein